MAPTTRGLVSGTSMGSETKTNANQIVSVAHEIEHISLPNTLKTDAC